MISGTEIKVLDKNAEYHDVPTFTLMENAGKGVADFINKKLKIKNKNILIFCGIGNNGGDGFVTARYLSENNNVTIFLIGKENDIKTDISQNNFKKLKKIKIYDIKSLKLVDKLLLKNNIIIDSILGIGLKGNLREPYLSLVKKINKAKKTILSVDVPTGLGCDFAIKPNYTVTFHDIKIGMNEKNSGKIIVVDIGIPKKAVEYVGPGELVTYYPKPKVDSHKGDNGRVLVIGGGPYIGAPALSGLAALRTGSDLVFILTPKKAAKAITSFSPLWITPEKLAKETARLSPNLIVGELTDEEKLILEDIEKIKDYLLKVDTVVIGPGLGSNKKTKEAIEKIILKCAKRGKRLVIDADAIQVVGKKPSIVKYTETVLTPHAGEFKELTNVKLDDNLGNRKKKIEQWAKKLDVTILLKGSTDIISNGKQTKLNNIHNPAMTVGGTGDVLAGIVGSLLSKGIESFNAARIGAFLNGSAGNSAFEKNLTV
jgi:hydroxyethylthiazole kinase-like uncharacterized protein yjeF